MAINSNYYKLTEQSDSLIVDLETARSHLIVFEDESDDALITEYIYAAQSLVQDWINQPLTESTYIAYYSNLDASGLILPHPYYSSITLQYVDDTNTLQTVPAANYQVDTSSDYPRIFALSGSYSSFGQALTINYNLTNPVQVTYITQLPELVERANGSPSRVKQAVLMFMTDLWNFRADDDIVNLTLSHAATLSARRLLKRYRAATL